MQDRGHSRNPGPTSELAASSGLKGWYANGGSTADHRPMRRMAEPQAGSSYAEPVVQGAHSSYYARRPNNEEPGAFRRSLRPIAEPLHPDRPEGKRSIPEPFGPPPHVSGTMPGPTEIVYRPPGHASEPSMPRLLRPPGITGLRETDQELSYAREMGQKVRVGQESYRTTGRAGDMSLRYGPTHRPEDDPTFFKSLKDSPTFLRYCNSLPAKPAMSPHERRDMSLRRQYESEVNRERELVASLHLPDPDEAADA